MSFFTKNMPDKCSLETKQMKQFLLKCSTKSFPVTTETKYMRSFAFFSLWLLTQLIRLSRKQGQKKIKDINYDNSYY